MTEIEGWQTIDEYGIQFPWYTRPCLKWLNTIDFTGKSVFEYGVGYSTLWYKSRGAYVDGVDHNKEWADMSGVTYVNCDSVHGQLGYVSSVLHSEIQHGKFDIICIDGIMRDQCIEFALRSIKKCGYIIIDNYKQATADLPEWPITENLIKDFTVMYYPEPTHEDWLTIVIHV